MASNYKSRGERLLQLSREKQEKEKRRWGKGKEMPRITNTDLSDLSDLSDQKDQSVKKDDISIAMPIPKRITSEKIETIETIETDNEEKKRLSTFTKGMEYFLTFNGKNIFRATYEPIEGGDEIHFKKIEDNEGRFFIRKVLKDVIHYPDFDEDVHCVGAAVMWRKDKCSSVKRPRVETPGTEEIEPILALSSPRKKVRPETWKKNIKKRHSNEGKGYEGTIKTGTETIVEKIKENTMRAGCEGKCRMDCTEIYSVEVRRKIFSEFHELPNIEAKRQYLLQRVIRIPKDRTRKRSYDGERKERRREFTYKYTFSDPDIKDYDIAVCQKMFLDTLGISTQMVITAHEKKTDTGALVTDERGRHGNSRKVDPVREQWVIQHIKSFKVVESHYVRKSLADYQFLPQDLSVKEMHRMYIEHCNEKGYEMENYDFYKRVFHRRFRLKFQKPKKDLCDKCTSYKNDPEKNDEKDEAHQKHISDKDYTRLLKDEKKNEARSKDDVVTAAFDLESVLLAPHGQCSSFYYSRRLKNHNLTVTEIDNMCTYAYLWTEDQGAKGSCEVSTCIELFLKEKRKNGVEEVNLFSDRCGGQNQNRMVFIMLSSILNEMKFKMIELTFLVPGHSQNENDTAHSVIEKYTKDKTIYTPAQWESTIPQAFKKNDCFMTVLTFKDVIDYKNPAFFPSYRKVLDDKCYPIDGGKKVMWSWIVQLKFSYDDKNKMFYKYDYHEEYRECVFREEIKTTRKNKKKVELVKQKYVQPVGISAAKKKDLLKLLNKGFIQEQHRGYYESLTVNKGVKDADDVIATKSKEKCLK